MPRTVYRLIFILFELVNIHSCSQASHKVIATRGRILYGRSFLNITGMAMNKCLAKCLEECKCSSFQICEDDKLCQLCSSRHEQSEEPSQERDGCTSFSFEKVQSQMGTSDQKSCVQNTNCCLTSEPCQNGGTCMSEPCRTTIGEAEGEARFSCKCRPGYQGIHCEEPIRSCRGYIQSTNRNGVYQVVDDTTNEPFAVFCSFWRKSRQIWTLIQSYKHRHKDVIEESFRNDTPVNEAAPQQTPFRLTFSKMRSIQRNSTKRSVYRYSPNSNCIEYEYVDIIGQKCYNCKGRRKQPANSTTSVARTCSVEHYGSSGCSDEYMGGIDNFGLFCCIISPQNCSTSSVSTVKTWLGDRY